MVLSPLIKKARKDLYFAVLNEQSHIMLHGIVKALSTAYEGADVTVIFKRNNRYELLASLLPKKEAQEVYSGFLAVMSKGKAFGFDTVFRKSADSSIMIPLSFNDMGKIFLIIDSSSGLICPPPSEEPYIIEPASAALRYYISTKLYYEMQLFECHDAKNGLLDRSYFMEHIAEKTYEDGYVCMIGLSGRVQDRISFEKGLRELEDMNTEAAKALQKVFMGLTMYSRLCFALIQEGDPYSIADKLCSLLTEHFGCEFSAVIVPIWDGGAYEALSIAENYIKYTSEGGVMFLEGDEAPEDFIDAQTHEFIMPEGYRERGGRAKPEERSVYEDTGTVYDGADAGYEDVEETEYREAGSFGYTDTQVDEGYGYDRAEDEAIIDGETGPEVVAQETVDNSQSMYSGVQPVKATEDDDEDMPFGKDDDEYVSENATVPQMTDDGQLNEAVLSSSVNEEKPEDTMTASVNNSTVPITDSSSEQENIESGDDIFTTSALDQMFGQIVGENVTEKNSKGKTDQGTSKIIKMDAADNKDGISKRIFGKKGKKNKNNGQNTDVKFEDLRIGIMEVP